MMIALHMRQAGLITQFQRSTPHPQDAITIREQKVINYTVMFNQLEADRMKIDSV